jgi:hypothetical protein
LKPPPKSLRVGHLTYRVIPLPQKERDECSGYCDSEQQVIAIDFARPVDRQLEILLHEISHAIWDVLGLAARESEERAVAVLAAGWTQVYQSNPELLRWISAASRATLPRLPKSRK